MRRFSFLIICLVAASLACGQQITATPAPVRPTDTAQATAEPPTETATATQPAETLPPNTAVVIASRSLHVRVRPSEYQPVTGYLRHGDSVILTGKCQTGWAEIEWDGGTAWVNADYLSANKCSERKSR